MFNNRSPLTPEDIKRLKETSSEYYLNTSLKHTLTILERDEAKRKEAEKERTERNIAYFSQNKKKK